MDGSMMNYMNMALNQPDPSVVGGYGAPAYSPAMPQGPYQQQQGQQVIDPATGQPVIIDPKTGQPMAHPGGPNYALGGWDGVNDKMRYLAQNARYNRAASQAVPGQSTSGAGGGGGGFGHLLHTIFGHNGGPGVAR